MIERSLLVQVSIFVENNLESQEMMEGYFVTPVDVENCGEGEQQLIEELQMLLEEFADPLESLKFATKKGAGPCHSLEGRS